MFTHTHKLTWLSLGLIVLATLIVRLWFISDHQFNFFYDQLRDAIYATNIAHGDLMIFGPSASGTKDTVYHGVIWYYFISIFYRFCADPQVTVNALAVLSSLYLVVIFIIARAFLKNDKAALLTTALMGFSSLTTVNATWLSNPALIYFFFPPFIYFAYRCYQKLTIKHFALVCLFLGLLTQAAIFMIYLALLLVIILGRDLVISKWDKKKLVIYLSGATMFCLTTASMIISELLLIKRGVLNLEVLKDFNAAPMQEINFGLQKMIDAYGIILARSFLPQFLILSFLLVVIGIYLYAKSKSANKQFLLLALLPPIIFMTVVFRATLHQFACFELLVYLILVDLILLAKIKFKRQIVLVLMVIFILVNLHQLYFLQKNKLHYNSLQKGVVLADQLKLIDETYKESNYQPFTFSSLTNPYGIDVTWHYLYNWYGREKYGYVPTFIGSSQNGYPQEQMLPETDSYALIYPTHFTIVENDTGLDSRLEEKFLAEQTRLAGTPSASVKFGELTLLEH